MTTMFINACSWGIEPQWTLCSVRSTIELEATLVIISAEMDLKAHAGFLSDSP